MSDTLVHIDQLGREVEISRKSERIISLVPSQTELLFDLGLGDRVVGITKFCVHPDEWFRTKTRVGGTKKIHFDVIPKLNPDLIIANKEENNQADIEALAKNFPVWVSDVNGLDSALDMIRSIAEITDSDASQLTREIETGFAELKPLNSSKRVLYLIWKNPFMAAGPETFINDLLERCGFENVVSETRYPELTEQQIIDLNPEVILLSSEPFPFKEKHIKELQELLRNAAVKLVDGEMFSWYGSRLKFAPSYFTGLLESISK
ncbi:MAG: ABC transporter substrate-binding protein [Flavobacteriales bacterium]|nr:ABC transporter substrate-binding protein [Flavobacteriales bacterium]